MWTKAGNFKDDIYENLKKDLVKNFVHLSSERVQSKMTTWLATKMPRRKVIKKKRQKREGLEGNVLVMLSIK